MRWFLEPFMKRLRERHGHRPSRPAARPALSLEGLEDRRLLSAAAVLQPAALLNTTNTALAAVAASSTPNTSAATAAASTNTSSSVTITQVSGSTIDAADWQAEAVYRMVFASYLASIPSQTTNVSSQAQTTPVQTPPATVGSSTPSTAPVSSAAQAAPVQTPAAPVPAPAPAPTTSQASASSQGTVPAQTTNPSPAAAPAPAPPPAPAASQVNTSSQEAAPAQTTNSVPAPAASSGSDSTTTDSDAATLDNVSWQAESVYRVAFSDASSILVRVRVGIAPEGPTPLATVGDAGSDQQTTDSNGQGAESALVVEVAVAADPTNPAAPDASAGLESAHVAALRLTIAPPDAGPSGAWSLNLTAGSNAGDAGQTAAPSVAFLVVVAPPGGGSQTQAASASPAPADAAFPNSAPAQVATPSAAAADPTPVSAGTAAAPGGGRAAASSSPALEATAIADMVLADWNGQKSHAEITGAVMEAAEGLAASAAGRVVETPILMAEQWAALSQAVRQAIVMGASTDNGALELRAPTEDSSPGGNIDPALAAPAGNTADTENHWSMLQTPFAVVGGVLLPAFGLGRADPTAAGAGADVISPVGLHIAETVRDSTDSLTGLVRSLYRALMGRSPQNGEEMGWVSALLAGQTEEQFLEAFLNTAEFGQRAADLSTSATPDEGYIRSLFTVLMQRPATSDEVSAWLGALPELGRDGVVACLVRSEEFRALQVQGFYQEVYGQSADPADAAAWAASPLHLLAIREAVAARPDLYAPTLPANAEI